jgi:hypothetical protein
MIDKKLPNTAETLGKNPKTAGFPGELTAPPCEQERRFGFTSWLLLTLCFCLSITVLVAPLSVNATSCSCTNIKADSTATGTCTKTETSASCSMDWSSNSKGSAFGLSAMNAIPAINTEFGGLLFIFPGNILPVGETPYDKAVTFVDHVPPVELLTPDPRGLTPYLVLLGAGYLLHGGSNWSTVVQDIKSNSNSLFDALRSATPPYHSSGTASDVSASVGCIQVHTRDNIDVMVNSPFSKVTDRCVE